MKGVHVTYDPQSGRIRLGQVMLTLAAVGLMVIAFALFSRTPQVPDFERGDLAAPRVVVSEVGMQRFELAVSVVGRISPWREVALAPEINGRVKGVHVGIGDHVDVGDVLLSIETDVYETAVREAEASRLGAQARLQESSSSLTRSESLRQRGAISEREYEAALASERAAEAALATAEAGLERAQRNLRETELVAPFAGTIIERHVDTGALVGRDRTVLVLADLETVAVEVGLTESEILRVRDATAATIESSNLPGRVATGELDGVAPVADSATGTYLARFRVDNREDPKFLGGMVVNVNIPYAELDAVHTVPSTAVVQPDEAPHVFVVRDGRAVRVALDIVARQGDRVGITAAAPWGNGESWALQVGDLVIIVGQSQVTDGTVVEIANQR